MTDPKCPVSAETRITIMLAEYRALYDLALFRLNSLDRRVPLTGTALAVFLGGTLVLPLSAKQFILIVLPMALVWFVRTTINHARSFEDAIRRIEQIEWQLNVTAGMELVKFQSSHPSRGRATGGRTGRETIIAALAAAASILLGCTWLTLSLAMPAYISCGLLAYFVLVALILAHDAFDLRRYRYSTTS